MDGRTYGPTDIAGYRVACMRIKMNNGKRGNLKQRKKGMRHGKGKGQENGISGAVRISKRFEGCMSNDSTAKPKTQTQSRQESSVRQLANAPKENAS